VGAPPPVPSAGADGPRPLRVVAFGGGHGLAAALAAWRRITPDLTAVVTVADDGGSSGRIRREMPVLPPGDLRMALTALVDEDADTRQLAALLQHRLGGSGALAGHPVGNLVLTGLTELHGGDCVRALDDLCRLLGARGRVLPMAASTRPTMVAAALPLSCWYRMARASASTGSKVLRQPDWGSR